MRILLRPEAEAELQEAAIWYEARSTGLGSEFLRAVDAALAAIERNLLAGPLVSKVARRMVLRRFPYNVIYTVVDEEILIVACMHGGAIRNVGAKGCKFSTSLGCKCVE